MKVIMSWIHSLIRELRHEIGETGDWFLTNVQTVFLLCPYILSLASRDYLVEIRQFVIVACV